MHPRPQAWIKAAPSDWRVDEQLDFDFTGTGEHACFYVEKTSLNTTDVARALASSYGVEPLHVGFCGLKDKHAVTCQWFSVPTASDGWRLDMPGVRCLRTARHTHKLRRGQHAGNRFRIRLTQVDEGALVTLHELAAPYPNYFGPQRVSPGNLAQALAWLAKGQWGTSEGCRKGRSRRRMRRSSRRGWHLSVLRSMLFNAVLDLRVTQGNYAQALEGDVLEHGVPTGPLWGRGRSPASGAAARLECEALAPHAETCTALEYTGVTQARRPLAVTPFQFSIEVPRTRECEIGFLLPAGAFATAMLEHRLDIVDTSKRYE